MKFFQPVILLIPLVISLLSSCKDHVSIPLNSSEIIIPLSTTDTILYANVSGDQVPIYLSIPPDCTNKSFPAIVLLHGSGGMWKDDNRDAGVMSSQNREWKDIFDENCIVGAYIDSYTPRGCIERADEWTTAPKAFLISSQFVRPYDAYAGLALLQNLVRPDGTAVIIKGKEGILGFSDGATALAATLYDTDQTPENWKWTQNYDGVDYDEADSIKPPAERTEAGGFACGVFYYGGSVGNSYWGGNPCSNPDFMYVNYAPILYQIPANGYLTENTLCAVAKLEEKNAPVTHYIYENAEHGFDGNDTDQASQSELARSRTIDWFIEYLNIQ